ncbi:MAG: NACHT domain-containing protein [Thainema sp.]
MSLAGKRSTQGDEYQLRVALHWLIRMLGDDSISGIQVDSTGIPGQSFPITVDDVVVLYADGRACFIQVKKNQTDYKSWSLADEILKEELEKARIQLESKENSKVIFYSRTPFGELESLVEACKAFPDYESFLREDSKKQITTLKKLASIIERPEEVNFSLVLRLKFGPPHTFEDWDRLNRIDLERLSPSVDLVIPILERYLTGHEATLKDTKHIINREEVWAELGMLGLRPTPERSETEILETFRLASRIGRNWLCTIDDEKIPRIELNQITELIEQDNRTILLTDRPGSGKTCLLLDLVNELENQEAYGLLFIKSDLFTEINNEQDLVDRGLPEDIVGQCARLAKFRSVVVIIDSLDELSLSRQHSALKVFLGLIDRLEKIVSITVIAACRDFDLQYDPLLRGRSWKHTIHLCPLDFESTVKPFLIRWGIDPSSISSELRELLQLPQHLRIYGELAKVGRCLNPASAYELYDSFLNEVIALNSRLGDQAITALQDMADTLMQSRSQSFSRTNFAASENIVRLLISQEILWDSSSGSLSFSHQTLAECLVVRSALAKSKTLVEFIIDHPQLPFIRPAVRAFFFFLRSHQPQLFRRQIRQVLSHKEIAYHVKRLVCESLAEIIPIEDDWRLFRRIFQNYPDLFRRLLVRTQSTAWLHFLKNYWLDAAQASEEREDWLREFCWKLRTWINSDATEVITLWRQAIAFNWFDEQRLIRIILGGLNNLQDWNAEGIRELLEILVKDSGDERDSLGRIISQWVHATNSGDDLLWRYITKDILPEDLQKWDLRDKLHCSPHNFHHERFLEERLKQSDQLLTLVLKDLARWSEIRIGFLQETSWHIAHSKIDIYPVTGLTEIFSGVEEALKHRARENDAWWKLYEPNLRDTQEPYLRYLIIQSYKENIEENISGIEFQLQDQELICNSELSYELGGLMQMSYPYISETTQINNQTIILSSCAVQENDQNSSSFWQYRKTYNLLIWISPFFRIAETQTFIDTWQNHFGYSQPEPEIYSRGGAILPPLSKENLLKLSDESLFRLLQYYQQYLHSDFFDRDLARGFNGVVSILREACSLHPIHFLDLYSGFFESDLHEAYTHALIEGISTHLLYRFGDVRPNPENAWQPIEPLPDKEALAAGLLYLLERYSIIWKDGRAVSRALEACCDVLNDSKSSERLTLLLFWTCFKSLDDEINEINEKNLVYHALNSTLGIAAKSAIKLCNNLLEKGQSLPELLPYLLHYFSRNTATHVRIPIVEHLPFLMYKQPALGWQLLADVFQKPQPLLWKHTEQCFYYQYRDNFHQVVPYLDRLLHEGIDEAGGTWGRISALAHLAGHIEQDQIFNTLADLNDDAWRGVIQVFSANLNRYEHTAKCHSGLITALHQESLPNRVLNEIEKCFAKEASKGRRGYELAVAFLNKLSMSTDGYDLYDFLEWLSYESRRDPLQALDMAELLAEKLETEIQSDQLWHTQPLISALNEILREADETDDLDLIRRAIDLQDRYLQLNIYGIEELFNKAG